MKISRDGEENGELFNGYRVSGFQNKEKVLEIGFITMGINFTVPHCTL
jgi:hypothetical protein